MLPKYFILILMAFCSIFPGFSDTNRLKLATTTSTDNSGLLGVLVPPFEEKYGVRVDIVAVGTGKALRLGEDGDVDVILVHAPAAEDDFMNSEFGINRRAVMHNDFVILGPPNDPAGIKGLVSAQAGIRKIAEKSSTGVVFVSRGDDSGTHKKEKLLWSAAGIVPEGRWYKEAGQGMGAVLTLASELRAYTISDRGTYLAMRDKIMQSVLVEGDRELYNPYSVIAVNPARHPHVEYELAMSFIAWITSVQGQEIIGDFKNFGELLFYPDAIP
ncbi:MAG: solute-binding protein [Spirochaetales bacterium]|jgi:tungstate transport system substrate-binding protein|nr:solute-binding protein [Spirochaetales bacterium]